jgi:hypothetical protein
MVYQHRGRVSQAGPKARKTPPSQVDSKSVLRGEREKKFCKKSTTDAGMLLKTKDRFGKLGGEAGMCMKTKILSSKMRECH